MAAHRHHGVVPICRVLQVAPSAVRSAMSRPVCARRQADDAIKPKLLAYLRFTFSQLQQRHGSVVGVVVPRPKVVPLLGAAASQAASNRGEPCTSHGQE